MKIDNEPMIHTQTNGKDNCFPTGPNYNINIIHLYTHVVLSHIHVHVHVGIAYKGKMHHYGGSVN